MSLIFLVAEAGECLRENRDDDAMLGPSLGERQMSNGGDMFDPHCPLGRLFYVLLVVLMALPSSQAQSPGTTTINEVRWSDAGWGPDNDRNLVGRFSTQSFVLPRLTKVQNYFLRQYDSSVPPRYSRYTAALHLDYPL